MNYFSDYGSGSSTNSSTTWPQDIWSNYQYSSMEKFKERKSASFQDLVTGKCTLKDIMKEFQMNGTDTPYNPVEDSIWTNQTESLVAGMGPGSAYLRQSSWPAPERSPAQRLPRPASDWISSCTDFSTLEFTSSTPVEEISAPSPNTNGVSQSAVSALTEEQVVVLNSLSNSVLFSLLNELEQTRDVNKRNRRPPAECRFCKNNGERESYFRSHSLKDNNGRVTCPVLRAFVCKRCGASGDAAHTIKYCPLSTADERMKSAAMLRSVRMASGRRRAREPAPDAPPDAYNSYAITSPLDPSWAALEQKLML